MTVQKLEAEMTFDELVHWSAFLKIKQERIEKQDLYLARIAYMLSGDKSAKFEDFIFKFDSKEKDQETIKLSDKDKVTMLKAFFGIEDKNNGNQ